MPAFLSVAYCQSSINRLDVSMIAALAAGIKVGGIHSGPHRPAAADMPVAYEN